jgi:hypothetical protein
MDWKQLDGGGLLSDGMTQRDYTTTSSIND